MVLGHNRALSRNLSKVLAMQNAIRRDIFSVKVLGNGFDQWCHERMFRNGDEARRYAQGIRPIGGYSLQVKIVHPAQWVVDGYCAAGNSIL